jgi:hypothetical protein
MNYITKTFGCSISEKNMVSNTGKVSILHFPNLEAVCCIAFSSINSKQPATHQEFPPKIKYPD